MRYRIRPALWERLSGDERSMDWLARQIGYSPQRVRLLHVRPHLVVKPQFAMRAALLFGVPIEDLFEPIDDAEGGDARAG